MPKNLHAGWGAMYLIRLDFCNRDDAKQVYGKPRTFLNITFTGPSCVCNKTSFSVAMSDCASVVFIGRAIGAARGMPV
jgi:hypothetical protein